MLATQPPPDYGPRRFHRSPPDRERAGSSVVEHSTFNRMVLGSNPSRPTTNHLKIRNILTLWPWPIVRLSAQNVRAIGFRGRLGACESLSSQASTTPTAGGMVECPLYGRGLISAPDPLLT